MKVSKEEEVVVEEQEEDLTRMMIAIRKIRKVKTKATTKNRDMMIHMVQEIKIHEVEGDQVRILEEEPSKELVLSVKKRVIEHKTSLMRKKDQEGDQKTRIG